MIIIIIIIMIMIMIIIMIFKLLFSERVMVFFELLGVSWKSGWNKGKS